MTCSMLTANVWRLSKQDNTYGTWVADMEQIIIWLGNNTGNKITKIMTCSKSTVNALGSYKRNDTDGIYWWHWTDHYLLETYAMTSKY